MRQGLGKLLLSSSAIMKLGFLIILYASAATGIWLPLGKMIVDNPVSLFWWGPLGLLITMFVFWISGFLYDLIVGLPLFAVTTWLLKEST